VCDPRHWRWELGVCCPPSASGVALQRGQGIAQKKTPPLPCASEEPLNKRSEVGILCEGFRLPVKACRPLWQHASRWSPTTVQGRGCEARTRQGKAGFGFQRTPYRLCFGGMHNPCHPSSKLKPPRRTAKLSTMITTSVTKRGSARPEGASQVESFAGKRTDSWPPRHSHAVC
jgi:hypothetical protein